MRIGLQLPSFTWPGGPAAIASTLSRIASDAEAAGFASLWVMDHFFQLPVDTGWGGPEEPMLESTTTLGYLARATDRIELGAMVGSVSARPPGVAIKAATTLDILSGGRAWFGLGAGWYEREARGLGLPWPDRPERFALLEETLQLAHQAWGGDRSAFAGRTIEAREPIVSPAPLSTPHPRILIGGVGERRTLRLVARYADACNILVPDPGESQRKLDVLLRHCEAVGRDPAEIETTALLEVDLERETTGDFIERLREQAREGIEHVIVNMPDAHDPRRLATFGREIIPAVTDVRPSGWPARPGREGSLAAPA